MFPVGPHGAQGARTEAAGSSGSKGAHPQSVRRCCALGRMLGLALTPRRVGGACIGLTLAEARGAGALMSSNVTPSSSLK